MGGNVPRPEHPAHKGGRAHLWMRKLTVSMMTEKLEPDEKVVIEALADLRRLAQQYGVAYALRARVGNFEIGMRGPERAMSADMMQPWDFVHRAGTLCGTWRKIARGNDEQTAG